MTWEGRIEEMTPRTKILQVPATIGRCLEKPATDPPAAQTHLLTYRINLLDDVLSSLDAPSFNALQKREVVSTLREANKVLKQVVTPVERPLARATAPANMPAMAQGAS